MWYNTKAQRKYGLVAQLGERTVRIREVRGFDPLQVHHISTVILIELPCFVFYVMMTGQARPRVCLRCWMMIGKQANKSESVEGIL